jgi:hypothetical protein
VKPSPIPALPLAVDDNASLLDNIASFCLSLMGHLPEDPAISRATFARYCRFCIDHKILLSFVLMRYIGDDPDLDQDFAHIDLNRSISPSGADCSCFVAKNHNHSALYLLQTFSPPPANSPLTGWGMLSDIIFPGDPVALPTAKRPAGILRVPSDRLLEDWLSDVAFTGDTRRLFLYGLALAVRELHQQDQPHGRLSTNSVWLFFEDEFPIPVVGGRCYFGGDVATRKAGDIKEFRAICREVMLAFLPHDWEFRDVGDFDGVVDVMRGTPSLTNIPELVAYDAIAAARFHCEPTPKLSPPPAHQTVVADLGASSSCCARSLTPTGLRPLCYPLSTDSSSHSRQRSKDPAATHSRWS